MLRQGRCAFGTVPAVEEAAVPTTGDAESVDVSTDTGAVVGAGVGVEVEEELGCSPGR